MFTTYPVKGCRGGGWGERQGDTVDRYPVYRSAKQKQTIYAHIHIYRELRVTN